MADLKHTRRTVVASSLAAIAATNAAEAATQRAPRGAGAAAGAPYLPAGFRDTFASRFVDANGLRMHAVIGGAGPPLLLVHGWPQTWYQWRLIMPALARDFTVVTADQRGIGLTDKPLTGYDAGAQANDLVALMDALGHRRFAMIGFDTGMPIGYALAADHPERIDRLVVGEAIIPGVTPSPPLILPGGANRRLWHIPFNRLDPDLNEALIRGREQIYFGAEFAAAAATPLPERVVRYYVERLTSADALRGSFGWYRAMDADIARNAQRKERRLTLPVLALGGERTGGETPANTMRLVADHVQSHIITDSGHWLAEEQPEQVLAVVTPFLAPYRAAFS
jgi:pimeloyl-ACP methyl ester carboxylesterase